MVSLIKNRKMKMGREHVAILVVDNKKIYLEDNNSKFGSLILIQYSNNFGWYYIIFSSWKILY